MQRALTGSKAVAIVTRLKPRDAPRKDRPLKSSVLLVECADRPGLVHGVSGALFRQGLNVVGNQEFVDRPSGRFYMRTEFDGAVDGAALLEDVRAALTVGASVRLSQQQPRRVVVLASKEHHCLADILVRHTFQELNAQVVAVVANHEILAPLTRKFDVPFHFVSAADRTREDHEAEMLAVVERYEPEFLVLAKYMRVLSPAFVRRFPARIVNIHHSFLPAFAGAKPYHQAFERGVKVIGATAHFVTDELDAGQIIVQQVVPVDHTHTAQHLVSSGRDVEQMVLAKALRLVFEDRVFLCGNRTVIFD
jgi:formyltetrahydrofolate deformylase